MVTIPKITIGRSARRNYFDKKHDVNTTSDFGFCQPTLVDNIVPDTKIKLKTNSFVRLAPLPVPTLGRIQVKQHTAFVPYRDVFLAYDAFMSEKSVSSGVKTYIPRVADGLTNHELFAIMLCWSFISSHNISNITNNLFFRLRAFTRQNTRASDNGLFMKLDSYYDPLNDESQLNYYNNNQRLNAYDFYDKLFASRSSSVAPFLRELSRYMDTILGSKSVLFDHDIYPIDTDSPADMVGINPNWSIFTDYNIQHAYGHLLRDVNTSFGPTTDLLMEDLEDYNSFIFSDSISIDNSDFIMKLTESINTSWFDDSESLQSGVINDVYFCIKLTPLGRRLFKILTACGVTFGKKNVPIDYLSLLSYYKVWFDKYNPGRNLQWFETNAYKLIHNYFDYNHTISEYFNNETIVQADDASDKLKRLFFINFLCDLPQCCYSLPVDNITVATRDYLNESNGNVHIDDIAPLVGGYGGTPAPTDPDYNPVNVYMAGQNNFMSYGMLNNTGLLNGLTVQMMERVYKYVNKNSILGQRIDAWLKAHNYGSPLPESLVLGDEDFSVFVRDVFSTAETSDGYLGEYAGEAKQNNEGKTLQFETLNGGILIQLTTIVPFGGYVQGNSIGLRSKFDFYNSVYDSLGREPLRLSEVLSRSYYINNFKDDEIFGFVPQYFNKKVKNNLANGGFSLRSQMSQFLPYSLDRIFTTADVRVKVNGFGREYVVEDDELPVIPDDYLRFIGRTEGFGNYNRIFYDITGQTDNFILDLYQDYEVYSPMKRVSESFDTFDDNIDNATINIEHS